MAVPGEHPGRGTAGTARSASKIRSNEGLDANANMGCYLELERIFALGRKRERSRNARNSAMHTIEAPIVTPLQKFELRPRKR